MSPPRAKASSGSGASNFIYRQLLQSVVGHPTFSSDVATFRDSFRTWSGKPGTDLYIRESAEHQVGLEQMATAFLEEGGKGALYWPDIDSSTNLNVMQYSRDHKKIKAFTRQIMLHLNQQQYHNCKRTGKNEVSVDDVLQTLLVKYSDRGAIDPVAVNSSDAGTTNPFGKHPGVWPKLNTTADSAESSSNGETANVDPPVDRVDSAISGEKGGKTDKATDRQPQTSTKQRRITSMFTPSKTGTSESLSFKRTTSFGGTSPLERPSKRVRTSFLEPDDDDLYSDPSLPADTTPFTTSIRHSARGRKVRQFREYATEEQYLEALESPTSSGKTLETELAVFQKGPQTKAPENTQDTCVEQFVFEHGEHLRVDEAPKTPPMVIRSQSDVFTSQHWAPESPQESASITPSSIIPPTNTPMLIPVGDDQSSSPSSHDDTPTRPNLISKPAFSPPRLIIPFANSPTPVPKDINRDTRAPTLQSSPPRSTPTTKPAINVFYSVVLSRIPIRDTEHWVPKGKFQDKTIDEIFFDLKLDQNVYGLAFVLEGPNLRCRGRVDRGDEGSFVGMKKLFNKQVRQCVAEYGSGTALDFDIEIEPLMRREQVEDTEDEDEEEEDEDVDVGW